jgi:hypothetical protein
MEGIQLRVSLPDRTVKVNVALSPVLVTPPGGAPSTIAPVSADDPDIKPFLDREQVLYDIAQRWDKVDKEILGFLGKCKSVNEALKLWPQIEMYIPTEFINRVNEKHEKSSKGPSAAAAALKDMDTDHLTTAAVISRMTGGQE